jgi:zinc transport system substrate-binding protein
MKKLIFFALIMSICACSSDNKNQAAEAKEKPLVAAVNYPLYYFAKTIGGNHIDIFMPAISGDPAYWKPNANQIYKYQASDLILANGAGYARWMEKVSLPSSKIIVTAKAFEDKWIVTDEGVSHSHGPDGEHVHKTTASTTWMNFEFAVAQAHAVYESLASILPDDKKEIMSNFNSLNTELNTLDQKMKSIAKYLNEETLIASHPVYQYMEAAYGITLISLHWEPDKMPTNHEWKHFEEKVAKYDIKIMLWEDEPHQNIKTKLDGIGVKYIVVRPSGNIPVKGDLIENLKDDLLSLEEALQK